MKQLLQLIALLISCNVLAVEDRGLFWRVQSPTATVYLLGSIHFADKSFYPLREAIEQAFLQADNLVLEVNMNADGIEQTRHLIQVDGNYHGEEMIRDHISADTYTKLNAVLQKLGIAYSLVERQKPGLLMMTLTSVQMMKMGFAPEQGIDAYFLRRAQTLGKPVLELESIEQQMHLMLNMSDGDLLLRESLTSLEQVEASMRSLVDSWKLGDAASMDKLIFEDTLQQYPDYQSIYEILFFKRNIAMAKKIQQYLTTNNSYFVVVGAGHLIGAKGIVTLLNNNGHKVSRF